MAGVGRGQTGDKGGLGGSMGHTRWSDGRHGPDVQFTLSDLGVFLGVVGGIMTSILLTVQKSKCKKIKCCGCECDRDPTLATDKAKLAGKDGDDKP